jgi:hypothetical protein
MNPFVYTRVSAGSSFANSLHCYQGQPPILFGPARSNSRLQSDLAPFESSGGGSADGTDRAPPIRWSSLRTL